MATWLITGCSTGLGRALATAVLDRGENVVVTARDAASVEDLARPYPGTALALSLDVTGHARIREVVRAARERFGIIDVLVNNAPPPWARAASRTPHGTVTRLATRPGQPRQSSPLPKVHARPGCSSSAPTHSPSSAMP